MKRSVSIKDVAARSGVSANTVSSVLNNKTEARIALETQERVRRIAQEMGYHPNAVAQSLRRSSTNVIGFYLHGRFQGLDLRNPFYVEVLHGLDAGCEAHRKDLLLHGSFRGGSVDDIHSALLNGQISGLALFSPPEDPLVGRLAQSRLPVVCIGLPVSSMPSVTVDDADGSRLLARRLAAQGHRRVLYLTGDSYITLTERRRLAFLEEATLAGMQVVEDGPFYQSTYGEEHLKAHVCDAPESQRPTAVACWYDGLAFAVLEACGRLGVRVPEALAIVGFDGIDPPSPPARRLTTIRAPWSEVAKLAVDLLIRRIDGEEVPMETMLPVTLALGDTA